jgi:hypothetical protein
MLLLPSNSIFVSASELHIFIYAHFELALDFTSSAWGTFLKKQIFKPGRTAQQ